MVLKGANWNIGPSDKEILDYLFTEVDGYTLACLTVGLSTNFKLVNYLANIEECPITFTFEGNHEKSTWSRIQPQILRHLGLPEDIELLKVYVLSSEHMPKMIIQLLLISHFSTAWYWRIDQEWWWRAPCWSQVWLWGCKTFEHVSNRCFTNAEA